MYWIYIPPLILVASLTALVIILGRKSADLKKTRPFTGPGSSDPHSKKDWKEWMNSAGRYTLQYLEKFLTLIKSLFKKTEQVISSWTTKLRDRRSGKKTEEISQKEAAGASDREVRIIREIEKTEEISSGLGIHRENISGSRAEVVVRKKNIDEPVVRAKEEPLPEDKVREAALIYRIAENPKDIEAYREIGDYYMGIGNIKDAKESFKMVLKLRPRDLKAKSSLREIEMRMRLGN